MNDTWIVEPIAVSYWEGNSEFAFLQERAVGEEMGRGGPRWHRWCPYVAHNVGVRSDQEARSLAWSFVSV